MNENVKGQKTMKIKWKIIFMNKKYEWKSNNNIFINGNIDKKEVKIYLWMKIQIKMQWKIYLWMKIWIKK